jgi:hypothetical protein
MSLTFKVSKKIKNQCESDRSIKLQVEVMDETKQSLLCDVSHCSLPVTSSGAKNLNKHAINCFWDRHKINGVIVRCPLRYKPKQVVKVYKSEVSKEEYTIKENVVKFPVPSKLSLVNGNKNIFQTISDNLEVTDAFCSFNCCLAWIRDNKHDRRYDQSEMLLHKIFRENESGSLNPSPHWRTLSGYGGVLSIEEFRGKTLLAKFSYKGPILDTGYLFSRKLNIC